MKVSTPNPFGPPNPPEVKEFSWIVQLAGVPRPEDVLMVEPTDAAQGLELRRLRMLDADAYTVRLEILEVVWLPMTEGQPDVLLRIKAPLDLSPGMPAVGG
jgi:hypothetical protein